MRPGPAAALALLAAAAGGAAVLLGAWATGRLDAPTRTTVVVRQQTLGDASAPVVVTRPLLGNGFRPAQIYRARSSGVVTVLAAFEGGSATGGQGSGFVVSRTGLVLTNAHVVTTAGRSGSRHAAAAAVIYVQFSDGDRVTARLVGFDLFDDVAVLRVPPAEHPLEPVPLGRSDRVVVGQPVAAIGSPLGNADSLTTGVVSAIRRSIPSLTTSYNLVDAIQTDASINHGNSGGPLFDAAGRVIGICAQIGSTSSAAGFEGVGFAVPIDSAKRSLAQLVRTGKVAYAYAGVQTQDLTASIAAKFGYAATQGALIDTVVPGAAADRAGLKAGDRDVAYDGVALRVGGDAILAINGLPVTHASDVVRIIAERLVPGETARFTVIRGSRRRIVRVTLGTRPG